VHLPMSLKNDPAGQEDAPAISKPTFDPVTRVLNLSYKVSLRILWSSQNRMTHYSAVVFEWIHIQTLISDQQVISNFRFGVYKNRFLLC
jgi:hypothetical protein